MLPAFRNGERVLTYNYGDVQKGSVVVFMYKDTIYIKRIEKIVGKEIFVVRHQVPYIHFAHF